MERARGNLPPAAWTGSGVTHEHLKLTFCGKSFIQVKSVRSVDQSHGSPFSKFSYLLTCGRLPPLPFTVSGLMFKFHACPSVSSVRPTAVRSCTCSTRLGFTISRSCEGIDRTNHGRTGEMVFDLRLGSNSLAIRGSPNRLDHLTTLPHTPVICAAWGMSVREVLGRRPLL